MAQPSSDLPPIPDLAELYGQTGTRSTAAEPQKQPSPVSEMSRHFWLPVVLLAAILGGWAINQHWVPNKWLFGDGAFYMNVARGVLENHSLRQESMHPHSWYDQDLGWNQNIDAAWSNIALGRNGEWWPKHPILMPLVSLPFIWAFGPLGSLVFQFVFYLLMALFAYRVATRVASRPAALAASVAFVATPWIYDRVWGFNNDVFYTVIVLAAIDAALGKKPLLAGALLGVGVFAKSTNVLYGPPLLLLFLLQKDFKGALRFCIAAAIPATCYLGLNWYMYGSPLATGYHRILIREHGQAGMHSHATDFTFTLSAITAGMKRVLTGPEGFLGHFPLFFPALLGVAVLAVRRWREAILLAWALLVPVAFHATYAWYRLEFNLPQLALSVAPLAALLPPFGRPAAPLDPSTSRVRWERLLPVAAVALLLLGAGVRRMLPSGDYFYRELPHAQVFLGDYPCDYFNNQMERWECSHYDNNDFYMTGRPLGGELKYSGREEKLLLLHPHLTGKERRLEYAEVPLGKTLHLRYGLADLSRPDAQVHFKVQVGDQVLLEEDVAGRKLLEKDLDTSALAGKTAKVSFAVTAANIQWCIFGVGGGPVN